MADSVEGAGFWLPSEFFDDFQVNKENLNKNKLTESDPEFPFPTEFPYDFGAKTDELVEKQWLMSTSPQSTLSQISCWTGRSAPGNDAVGDLIYLAAGEVARLKLHGGGMAAPAKTSVIPNIYLQQQQMVKQHKRGCEMLQKMYQMRMVQNAWSSAQQNPSPGRIHGSGGGATAKRGCAGTGVFLPRPYNNNDCNVYSSDSRKKPGYSAPSIPNRNVHAINKNFDNTNGFTQPEPRYHPKLGWAFVSEYDLLMARRNALLQHHQSTMLEGSTPMNCGVPLLPQEWTY